MFGESVGLHILEPSTELPRSVKGSLAWAAKYVSLIPVAVFTSNNNLLRNRTIV